MDRMPIGPIQALKRSIAFLADALFLGLIAWAHMRDSPEKQRLGDAWADMRVVFRQSLPLPVAHARLSG